MKKSILVSSFIDQCDTKEIKVKLSKARVA